MLIMMSATLVGQIILNPINPGEPLPDCISILNNTSQSFERGEASDDIDACRGLILIMTEDIDPTFIEADVNSFDFTFSSPGRYYIYCDAVEPIGAFDPTDADDVEAFEDLLEEVALRALCIDVVEPVPTMSEWGLICMLLTLLIFGVTTIKARQRKGVVAAI